MAFKPSTATTTVLLAVLVGTCTVLAIDNGKGMTPPMGWRSWNLYGSDVNQKLMETQMAAITDRSRLVNGVPTSLADLGYNDVGLDDNWQACGKYGPEAYTFHDGAGYPIINKERFPDFIAMTDYAHSLNLTAGWYLNNCICKDSCTDESCYRGDVGALIAYGFDSVKLDGCSGQMDLDLWSNLMNQTGKAIMIENCHWGNTVPNNTWCPWNFYRTSGDIRSNYGSIVSNLLTTTKFAREGLSYPGCWAYPDMLEVGCATDSPPGLTHAEARSHFGAWCVVSSPLTLSHDLTNKTVHDEIWDIITNTEALRVNQAWAGHSGSVYLSASDDSILRGANDDVPAWQMFYKPIDQKTGEVAVLIMNHSDAPVRPVLDFSAVPGLTGRTHRLRDLWARKDVGIAVATKWMPPSIPSHDSVFVSIIPVA